MTHISFTSGEILNIIQSLQDQVNYADDFDEQQLAIYYENIIDQFQLIYEKLQEFVPENRVANLVLAVN
jgi:molecular chaperone GrpE (heat shock protein)